jgi:hypothetical protein
LLFLIKKLLQTKPRAAKVKAMDKIRRINAKNKADLSLFKELFRLLKKANMILKDNSKVVNLEKTQQKYSKEKV